MSTIKVTNIEHESTANGGIQLDSSGHVTVDGQQMPTDGSLSNRNILINGSMQVAQRGTVTGVTIDSFGGPDRYKPFIGTVGTWTLSQAADAPSGTGLNYSYKYQCTTTGTVAAGSYLGHRVLLEGHDSARLNGQQFTISFWVKCNKTGTMTCEPYDGSSGANKSVSKQFTINAANTWEYKTITYPANPNNYTANSSQALVLHWWMTAGSSWKTTAATGQWTTFANGYRAHGCNIDLTDSTSNYFQITGIQLEVGEKATPFEHINFGDELSKCMRYYEKGVCFGMYKTSDDTFGWTQYSVQKRENPGVEINPPGSNPNTNQAYYHSTSSSDRGNRSINEINPSGQVNGQSYFKNGFIATMGGFTPASTNDAMWTGNYIADAEL